MNEDIRISKIDILLNQQKYAEAEKAVKEILAENPINPHLLSILAEVFLHQGKFDEAHNAVDQAIALVPNWHYLFYIKSRIAFHGDDLNQAEKYINQAIELVPNDADCFAVLAQIQLSRKQYETALETANQALALDPEHLQALNIRSSVLIKLKNSEAAFQTIEGALRGDPNNAYTHANYGWGLLENGDHKKALEHFKEALKIDPNSQFAQSGMLEALKATSPFYRMFLKYAFFMNALTSKYQWGVIIGFYLGFRVLKNIAKNNEALQPVLIPILVVLALLAFSTWVITPISNLFLRFNLYGQLLLDKSEKMSSNFVAASFGLFVAGLLLYLGLSDQNYLSIAIFGFAMMLPFSVMFAQTKYKNVLLYYVIGMVVIGFMAIAETFSTGELLNKMSTIFVLCFVTFQWVANYLLIKSDR